MGCNLGEAPGWVAERDSAMAQVAEHAEAESPGFQDCARAYVLSYLAERGRASGEELTEATKAAGIVPPDDRAFGAVYGSLRKDGKIRKAGSSLRTKGHGTAGGNVWELVPGEATPAPGPTVRPAIGAVAPWYGGKRTLAPKIVEQLGKHRNYWEPFCGSCAVLFSKDRVTYECVNDLHADLINLARVLKDRAAALALYEMVRGCLFHEGLLPAAREYLTTTEVVEGALDVRRAFEYLVFSWMGLNGVSGTPMNRTGTFAVRYSGRGGNGATRWGSVVASLPDWHDRLLGVQILQRDGFKLLERVEDEDGTAIYCDPPYIDKGSRYVHDFAAEDHQRLAGLLGRFKKARVVVSYYAHPWLSQLYRGWTLIGSDSLGVAKSMCQGVMREGAGRVDAPEVLLVNGPAAGNEGASASLKGE
jgi:DNA adenine methylase